MTPAAGVLVVETDRVMVRYRDRHLDGAVVEGDWHEVKLGLAGGWQARHLRQPSYVAAREPAVAFARLWGGKTSRERRSAMLTLCSNFSGSCSQPCVPWRELST
jgi:hypothetical protein